MWHYFLWCATALATSQFLYPHVPVSDGLLLLGGCYGSYSPLGLLLAFSQEHHYCASSDICLIVNASDFCNNILSFFSFYPGIVGGQVVSPNPNFQEDQGVTICLVDTLQPFWHWWPYQEYKTPVDIALGFIETRKLAYQQVKVVTPLWAVHSTLLCSNSTQLNWIQLYWTWLNSPWFYCHHLIYTLLHSVYASLHCFSNLTLLYSTALYELKSILLQTFCIQPTASILYYNVRDIILLFYAVLPLIFSTSCLLLNNFSIYVVG